MTPMTHYMRACEDLHVVPMPFYLQSHAKGDPEPDQHVFQRVKHKVVICEGLYLLHDRDGWEEVGPIFDLTIHMNSNLEFCTFATAFGWRRALNLNSGLGGILFCWYVHSSHGSRLPVLNSMWKYIMGTDY